jgi:Dolichyl-phosphate-mannose-protein mannosyltransferase
MAKPVIGLLSLTALILMGRELYSARRFEAAVYPYAGATLGMVFTWTLASNLARRNVVRPTAPTWDAAQNAEPQSHSHRPTRRSSWPLLIILTVQSALSLSLVWANTAFTDEANYLWTGRLELSGLLHGTPVPSAVLKYSGSPILYPPLGAIADALGGLAAARILSLGFMLMATALLYSTCARMFGRAAGIVAAAAWGLSGGVTGFAFASFYPMSIMLTALAVWCGVRAADSRRFGEYIAASGIVLALANATAYSSVILDVAVIPVIGLALRRTRSRKEAVSASAWLAVALLLALTATLTAGHSWIGLWVSVLDRRSGGLSTGHQSALTVLVSAWNSSGFIALASVAGAVLAFAGPRKNALLSTAACASVFLVPAGQIYSRTTASIGEHAVYGEWIAAIAIGCGAAVLADQVTIRKKLAAFSVAAVFAFIAIGGLEGAVYSKELWPNSSAYTTALRRVASHARGNFYVLNNSGGVLAVSQFYVPQGMQWRRWLGANLLIPASGKVPAARALLSSRKPGAVVLFYRSAPTLPASLVLSPRRDTQAQLLRLVATQSGGAGLASLTTAIEGDPAYALKSVGSYGTRGQPGIFAIWQRRS